jgi:hypothetical protein
MARATTAVAAGCSGDRGEASGLPARLGLLGLGLLLAGACVGGQSGNEGAAEDGSSDEDPGITTPDDGGDGDGSDGPGAGNSACGDAVCSGDAARPDPRPCGQYTGRWALRGVVASVQGGLVELQVHEVLDGRGCVDPDAEPVFGQPAIGERVGGAWNGALPCGGVCADVTPGDEVVAFYQRGNQDGLGCPDYQACSDERCGDPPGEGDEGEDFLDSAASWDLCDMECLEDTREACAQREAQARLEGSIALAPWQPVIELGCATVQDEDAYAVVDDEACDEVVQRHAGDGVSDEPDDTPPDLPPGAGAEPAPAPEPAPAAEPDAAPPPDPTDAAPAPMPGSSAPSGATACALSEGSIELDEPPALPECNAQGGVTPMSALHGNADRCPGPDDVAIECRDVCGTLDMCSDGAIGCDDCLARCNDSPAASVGGGTCLSRAIYLIDEEGCERMLQVYADFDADVDCE